MNILGINAYHGDSSACLVMDGKLIAAVEEERFRRIKHWAGFPSESIRWCLQEARLNLSDLDRVAMNRNPRANLLRKAAYVLTKAPSWKLLADRLRYNRSWLSVPERLEQMFSRQKLRAEVIPVEHHLAHMASGYLVSPYEEATVVSVDGFGDFASAGWGVGRGTRIDLHGEVHFPHSLGIFYQALTQYLGFVHYGDEYKVMGLAPYGEPTQLDVVRQLVGLKPDGTYRLDLNYFRHHKEFLNYTWREGTPSVDALYSPALEQLLGPARKPGEELTQRHRDLARSVQAVYEEAFLHLLKSLHGRYHHDAVTLAGGCAMNSVANGKIVRQTPFKRVYVQAAAGDAGGALGAAYSAYHARVVNAPRFRMDHAFWGPQYPTEEVARLVDNARPQLLGLGCSIDKVFDEKVLCGQVARWITEEKVIGWFQGRMEWGPRALGNRSILGDPRSPRMKDILNAKIKRRESFRPFAPSILREKVSLWFETDADVYFMTEVFQVRADKRALIPAVTHVDGSGRIQTVHEETHPLYYRLIATFESMTGVPMILNTSFNENEPIVCRPEEALDCFLRTDMDALVLGPFVIKRRAHSDQ